LCKDICQLRICDDFKPDEFNEMYDFIFDKGCLYCILTGPQGLEICEIAITEIYKSLKVNGIFYMISIGKPEERISIIKPQKWQMEVELISKN